MSAEKISDNCWGIIFSFLDIFDHIQLGRTSKWLSNVGNKPWSWYKNLRVTVNRITYLEWLLKYNVRVEMMNLKNEVGMPYLKHFKYLHTLKLGPRFADKELKYLSSLTQLQKLDLNWCKKITDEGLVHIKDLVNLRKLNLWSCEKLTDKGLIHIKGLINLQELDLSWCSNINKGFVYLKDFVKLQKLDLSNCRITDNKLAYLKNLINLKALYLCWCTRITDEGLAHLQGLVNLQKLNLSYCYDITNEGLAHIENLPKLRMLWCTGIPNIVYLKSKVWFTMIC